MLARNGNVVSQIVKDRVGNRTRERKFSLVLLQQYANYSKIENNFSYILKNFAKRRLGSGAEERYGMEQYLFVKKDTVEQIDEKMPPEEELKDLAEFYKVFGDVTRLKILNVLLCSEMCVLDIASVLHMSQSAISHQLRILKQMDLVKNRRDGKTIFYSLADSHIKTILNQGLDHIEDNGCNH